MVSKITSVIQFFITQGVLMKRAGFTMIELIFVIVILGILSAVALPKFIGVSDQARAGKCKAFVGTLNRTVGPTAWSQSISEGKDGNVSSYLSPANITKYTDVPSECNDSVTNAHNSYTFGSSNYDMNFTDGNTSNTPRWTWEKLN